MTTTVLAYALLALALCTAVYVYRSRYPYGLSQANTPYLAPYIPFLGAVGYAIDPLTWMDRAHARMGDVFTTMLLGYNVTFIRGQPNIERWAQALKSELDVVKAYKTISGPVVGPEVFDVKLSRTSSDGMSTRRLDAIQADLVAFTQEFLENKLPNSFRRWSPPIDFVPFLIGATFQLAAYVLCGASLAEKHGSELAQLFHVLENDLSILGIALPFATPTVRRRDAAKKRAFDLIEGEIRARLEDMKNGRAGADDLMKMLIEDHLDDDAFAAGDQKKVNENVKLIATSIYGLIWGAHTNTASSAIAAFSDLLSNAQYVPDALSQPSNVPFTNNTFLLRCLTETFRRRSRGTLLRQSTAPFVISDSLIAPPGFLLVSPMPLSLNPQTYRNASDFDPTRYEEGRFPHTLDSLQSPSVASSAGLFGAWGLGKHACPGRFLAYRIVGTLILTVLRGWDVELVGDPPQWKAMGYGGIDRVRGPLMVRMRKKVPVEYGGAPSVSN